MFGSGITLLLLTRHVLARVDMRGGKRPTVRRLWLRERFDSESIGTLIDATYRLGPKTSNKVWVFSSEFWTGVIDLPRDVVRMVADDELDQAIAGEAETYSGISAFDSRVGVISLPTARDGEHAYWCTQVPNLEVSDIKLTLESLKTKFGGIAHPAIAFPPAGATATNTSSQGGWTFTQSLGDQTLCQRGMEDRVVAMTSLLGSLDSGRVIAEWQEWQEQSASAGSNQHVWLGDHEPSDVIIDSDARLIRLDHESGLRQWAIAIAAAVASGSDTIPTLRAEKVPLSNERATALAIGLGVIAMGACAGHHWFVNQQIAEANTAIEKLEKRAKLVNDAEQQLKAIQKSTTELETKVSEAKSNNERLSSDYALADSRYTHLRQRWVQLLKTLEANTSTDCWVREIRGDSSSATFVGVATSTSQANHFSRDLEAEISQLGWRVSPAVSKPNDFGLVEFTIELAAFDQWVQSEQNALVTSTADSQTRSEAQR